MNHVSNELKNVFKECLSKLDRCINKSSELLNECENVNLNKECFVDRGIIKVEADECLGRLLVVKDHCNKHIDTCNNKDCIDACKNTLVSCDQGIGTCEKVIEDCSDFGKKTCVEVTRKCLQQLQKTKETINKCLDTLESKS